MKHSEQVADYINSLIIQHLQPITKSRDETLGKLKKALSFLDDNNESSEIKAISRESDLDYIKEIEKIIDKKFEEMNLEEISQEMSLTKERVRQIKDNALVKLKCEVLCSNEYDTYKELI